MESKEIREQKYKKDHSFIYIGLAFVAGAVIVYFLLRNRLNVQQRLTQQYVEQSYQPITGMSSIEHRLTMLEQNIRHIQQPIQLPIQMDQPVQQNTYKNAEKWKIIRDVNGDITEIEANRDAKVT